MPKEGGNTACRGMMARALSALRSESLVLTYVRMGAFCRGLSGRIRVRCGRVPFPRRLFRGGCRWRRGGG
jgi:hypothetical protein